MASQATYVTTGSNTLRGGKNKYRAATLNDNWVEDRYDPKFDGVRPSAATTTRDMELEGKKRSNHKHPGCCLYSTIHHPLHMNSNSVLDAKVWCPVQEGLPV